MISLLRQSIFALPLIAAVALAGLPDAAEAAQSSGGATGELQRGDVGNLAGQYILLNPLWVPIRDTAGDRMYNGGLLIRLEPDPAHKVDACYAVPDIVDALVVDFYENRLTRKEHKKPGHVAKRVQDVVDREAGKGVFGVAQVFEQVPEMDDNSIKLSQTCQ